MKKTTFLLAIAICMAAVSCTKEAGPDIMIDGKPQQRSSVSASAGQNSSSAYDPNGSSGRNTATVNRGVAMDPDGKQ